MHGRAKTMSLPHEDQAGHAKIVTILMRDAGHETTWCEILISRGIPNNVKDVESDVIIVHR